MNAIDGKTISGCFKLVSRVGAELEALSDTLANRLVERVRENDTNTFLMASKAIEDCRSDDSTWIYTDISYSLPLKLKGKGNRSAKRYLGYQISTMGDGIELPGNAEPLLHVFCWDRPIDFSEEEYVGFPLEEDADEAVEIAGDRLISWGGNARAWYERSWMYSIRLTAINSPADLTKYIVEPALALMNGVDAHVALPDGWLDSIIVRYPAKESIFIGG